MSAPDPSLAQSPSAKETNMEDPEVDEAQKAELAAARATLEKE
jgi:hypothetical protein